MPVATRALAGASFAVLLGLAACSDSLTAPASDASILDASVPETRPAECARPDDCTGFGDPCYASVSCAAGRCAFALLPFGATLGPDVQVRADCLRVACDGFGKRTKLPDSSDPEDDNDPCTRDFCIEGTPHATHPPLPAGTACDGGPSCVDGKCLGEADASVSDAMTTDAQDAG